MSKSPFKKVTDKVRLAIAAPFNLLAISQTMGPPYDKDTRLVRLADWVNTHVLPKDLD
jgi:hypothetical protein